MIGQDELRQIVAKHMDTGRPGQPPACACGWEGASTEPQSEHLSDVIVAAVSGNTLDQAHQSA